MVRIDLKRMTLKQIGDLESRIAAIKAMASDSAKPNLKPKSMVLWRPRSSRTISDLYPMASRGKKRSKSAAKYANPEDRSETWTGRGRKPNWPVARLKKGSKIEDFAI